MYPNAITERTGKKSSTSKLESNTDSAPNIDSSIIGFSNISIQTFIERNAISMPLDRNNS
jgi:hypothetical protein